MERNVGEVEGCLIVEGFVGKEEDFEMDTLSVLETVELLLEDKGVVVTGAGIGEKKFCL